MATFPVLRNISRLRPETSTLFICDLQERFRSLIYRFPTVICKTNLLSKTATQLDMPILVTEHVSRVFGKTVPEIDTSNARIIEKDTFTMLSPEVLNNFTDIRKQVVLCGIESHVCLLQTALDLLSTRDVFVVCDAVSSQRSHDRSVALAQMQQAGAVLITAESAVFQLMYTSKHPKFKVISGFIKDCNQGANEFANDTTV